MKWAFERFLQELEFAVYGRQDAGKCQECRGLASAIWPQKCDDFASSYLQVQLRGNRHGTVSNT